MYSCPVVGACFRSYVLIVVCHFLGATIASVTVCIDVPNKNDPNSILRKLQKIASASNTVSNRGLKDLVTAGKRLRH